MTFHELITQYWVVIPLLQRDYAQGRTGAEVAQIRQRFLDSIETALQPAAASLDLGLIYGTIRRDPPPKPPTTAPPQPIPRLVLLDGQQRITTLWLLHWYLTRRVAAPPEAGGIAPLLARFAYETRTTARDFCTALATQPVRVPELTEKTPSPESSKDELSKSIRDEPWFFLSWERDPTVGALLVMLDAIHTKFGRAEHAALLDQLTLAADRPAIFFEFLSMTDHGLTDELYLKMNARGAPLTEFEKFKAWLERHARAFPGLNRPDPTQPGQGSPVPSWETELDKDWTDFFWRRCGGNVETMDRSLLNFFKGVALNRYVVSPSDEKERNALINEVTDEKAFMPTKSFEALFTPEALADIFCVLRALCAGGDAVEDQGELLQKFVAGEPSSTYPVRVRFHALCRFLIERKPDLSDPAARLALGQWQRVVRHLAEHTNIDNYGRFTGAVRSIQEAAGKAGGDILAWLVGEEKPFPGFFKYQVDEERRKARLILSQQGWPAAIPEIENHSFFRGQITFLLDMSRQAEGGEDCARFLRFARLAKEIFVEGSSGLLTRPEGEGEFLWERALLAEGDWLVWFKSDIYRFVANRAEWLEKVFRDPASARLVQAVLEKVLLELEGTDAPSGPKAAAVREILRRLVACRAAEPLATSPALDWRQYLVRSPEMFAYCHQRKIRRYDEGIERYILLMSAQKPSAGCAELRTYSLYVRHLRSMSFDPFKMQYQDSDNSIDNEYRPYVLLSHARCQIRIHYLVRGNEPTRYFRLELLAKHDFDLRLFLDDFSVTTPAQRDETNAADGTVHFDYAEEGEVIEDLPKLVAAAKRFLAVP